MTVDVVRARWFGAGALVAAGVVFALSFALHWDEGLGITVLVAAVGLLLLAVSSLPRSRSGKRYGTRGPRR